MSHTIGHTKRQHKGWCSYRTAKPFKQFYNRCYRSKVRQSIKSHGLLEDFQPALLREVADIVDHPGDLW